jgi:putative salt-induced outer membrane protein YdiY
MGTTHGTVLIGLAGVLALAGFAGGASASDGDAANRVAEARAAYERALAELRAAEAALEAARAEAGVGEAETAGGAGAQPEATSAPAVEGEAAEQPDSGFFSWDSWEKSIDIGLTGASGNSENTNFRVQLGAERLTKEMETKIAALYRYSKSDGEETENRFRADIFNDWLPPEGSKIRWWAKGSYEYDEFQSWDQRVTAAAGLGYELIKNDKHTLVGRLGFGGSQTIGGPDEEFRPEAIAGLDYAFKISERQKFEAGTEFLLDVSDTEQWRNNTFARYEAVLDAESGMNFKTGVTNRYDSAPGGDAKKNDLEYFATLGWTF